MRLPRTADPRFEDFEDEETPPYAILSHRWLQRREEVTYQEMANDPDTSKAGYKKIVNFVKKTKSQGFEYAWIDTCCIDKTSSAELSEAINSMYLWYKTAAICYAYLSDVLEHADGGTMDGLASSNWFERGWTLQELIAPKEVIFYNASWQQIGDKTSLRGHISAITNIPCKVLQGAQLNTFSAAEKMSWASNRRTTRVEDIAYSLMGLFGVNMPLLYGEKEKAFFRLQQQIIEATNDQSIFAWKDQNLALDDEVGMLARSPRLFAESNGVRSLVWWSRQSNLSITSHGLRIELWLIPADETEQIFLASLACMTISSHHHSPGVYLKRITGFRHNWRSSQNTHFVRVRGSHVEELSSAMKLRGQHAAVYIQHEPKVMNLHDSIPSQFAVFEIGWRWASHEAVASQFVGFRVLPVDSWDPQSNVFTAVKHAGVIGAIITQHSTSETLTLFGFGATGKPWVNTVFDPPFPVAEWQQHPPPGRQTAISEAVITEAGNGQVICRSFIRMDDDRDAQKQELYSIFVEGELRAIPLTPSAESTRVMNAVVHEERIRKFRGEVDQSHDHTSYGRRIIRNNAASGSAFMINGPIGEIDLWEHQDRIIVRGHDGL